MEVSHGGRHVSLAEAIFADDTPISVLAPGTGKTQTARLWTYARDERSWGGDAPPPPPARPACWLEPESRRQTPDQPRQRLGWSLQLRRRANWWMGPRPSGARDHPDLPCTAGQLTSV